MSNVYIVGLGMIRFNKYPDRNVRDMAHEVIRLALDDAELSKEDLQSAFFCKYFLGNVYQPAFHQGTGGDAIHGSGLHSGDKY